uniref:Adaptin ear-binding coat-associated protein 1 n=1 Tax=Aceria tosichella TaxID=561515 RepID=A0A6G1SKK2_9ACAR
MSNPAEDYERVLLVKPAVYVYKIPPLMSASRGFRAADWNLAQPDWNGRLRLISVGEKLLLKIEDCSSGALYCQAPILAFPGPQLQAVSDSRRYFVVKVVSDTGRTALIGIGFADGADSFDLTVALQDHFASLGKETELKLDDENRPKLDLTLKGDIRVNLNIGGTKSTTDNRPKSSKPVASTDASQPFFLPPPPASSKRR